MDPDAVPDRASITRRAIAARVEDAVKAQRRTERRLEEQRAATHAAALAALAAGITQAQLVKLTGYTRERLRQIARGAGSH